MRQITQGRDEIFYVAPQGQLMAAPTQIASDEPMPVAGTPVAPKPCAR